MITSTGFRRRLVRRIVAQFMHPRGWLGRLVGWEMTLRPSNRKRNRWAVSLLDVQPTDRVLEIGFGPGLAIRELARRATSGQVIGIDRSEVMHAQATRRNRSAVHVGRVSLTVGSVDDLPDFDSPFDKILAVNNMGMWPEPVVQLKDLARLLRIGGEIAIVSQPRCPGATAETTQAAAREIAEKLEAAGLVVARVETLDLEPPVTCVIGTTADATSASADHPSDT